nr:sulfotransferase family 2 domain-containing protein [Rubrivivax benzoatilyticus]
MLCSHIKKFIYLKTKKTAGTSTEIFFEKSCCPPSLYVESHARQELVTDAGIIGYRGPDQRGSTYFHHMTASQVRSLLGEDVWQSYFKFCVMRNPYDKVVSMFWMQTPEAERERLAVARFEDVRDRFSDYVRNAHLLPLDRSVYMIDEKVAVDFFIRFEHLREDLQVVCDRLDIRQPVEGLGRYKTDCRLRPEHFGLYYNEESTAIVRQHFAWEIEQFRYGI